MYDIYNDNFITFKEDTHQYFDINNVEYTSVSRLYGKVKEPFNADLISMQMARGNKAKAEALKQEWKKKATDSQAHGNFIHNNLELFEKTGNCHPMILPIARELFGEWKLTYNYAHSFSEKIYYDIDNQIAGMADQSFLRHGKRSSENVLDIYDYKTNLYKGIYFDSIKRDEETSAVLKHANRYMLYPFDSVEACNYHDYTIQLNTYGRMAEKRYKNIKIGRLSIVFIFFSNTVSLERLINNDYDKTPDYQIRFIPVPYFPFIGDNVLSLNKQLKQLPA